MRRVLRRAVTQLGQVREDMTPGCPERLDLEFFRFVWTFKAAHDAKIAAALETHGRHAALFRLRSDREIEEFLAVIT